MPQVPAERLSTFTFDHVISQRNLIVLALETGAKRKRLEFNYNTREQPEMVAIPTNIYYIGQ